MATAISRRTGSAARSTLRRPKMHSLSETLLAAQRDRAAIPYVHATLAERWGGVTQLRWERLASGQEPDGPHDAVITSGGSLIRVRAQADPNGLFIQRTASPGPDAQFGAWRNLGATFASGGIAVIEIGGQIHVFDVGANQRTIRERTSRDDGVTFGSPRTVATAAANVTSLAAASATGGGALVLYAESTGAVRSMTRAAGTWSSAVVWTNSLRTVDGIACAHIDGDWAVVVCGTLSNGSSGVWTCTLGAGSSQTAETWSMLREVIASAAGADDIPGARHLHGGQAPHQLCGGVWRGGRVLTDDDYGRGGCHALPRPSLARVFPDRPYWGDWANPDRRRLLCMADDTVRCLAGAHRQSVHRNLGVCHNRRRERDSPRRFAGTRSG